MKKKSIFSVLLCALVCVICVGVGFTYAPADKKTSDDFILTAAAESEPYLDLQIIGKSWGTWTIRITNNYDYTISAAYNEKMCFRSDAEQWGDLSNVKVKPIKPQNFIDVEISENWFADYITVSHYTDNVYRYITCAHNLDKKNKTMTILKPKIAL